MRTRRPWLGAAACALVLGGATLAGAPSAAAEDVALYLSGTRQNPVPAGQIDLTKVNASLANYGVAQQIGYLASLFPVVGQTALDPSVATGVAATEAAIAALPDGVRIVIVDVSQGGIVASRVERDQLAAGSTRTFLFVRIGDPTGPTGIMGRNPGLALPGLTFVTAPDDSPWNRIIITHQYEGLSDWPAQQLNLLADINALLGAIEYHNPWSYAVDLSTLPDSAVTVTVNSVGATTTTYRIPATGLLPILRPFQAVGVNDATLASWQKVLKPIIDSAYTPAKTSTVAALGSKLFVAAVNGMTTGANRAGITLRQTQRYLDAAISQWQAKSRPAAATTVAAPTSVVTSVTSRAVPDVAPAAGQSISAAGVAAPGSVGVQTETQEPAATVPAQPSGRATKPASRRAPTLALSRPLRAGGGGRKPSVIAAEGPGAVVSGGPSAVGSAGSGDDTPNGSASPPSHAHETTGPSKGSEGGEASGSHDH
ncbi:PE-PPE domain-containing protein [Mycolicibacterium sp. Y3]